VGVAVPEVHDRADVQAVLVRHGEFSRATATASAPVTTLEVPNVTGDVPALGRLIVTDTATQSRRFVEWGLEGPLTYNSARASSWTVIRWW
jgi:hypothetical protein